MKWKQSLQNTLRTAQMALPVIMGILLIVNLVNAFFQDDYARVFSGNTFLDPILGSVAGSISFGIPVSSYIVGGELLREGVSLLAVTAFILAWTTVGVAFLPMEAAFLGKRFAAVRNGINFIFSLVISILVIQTLDLFGGL